MYGASCSSKKPAYSASRAGAKTDKPKLTSPLATASPSPHQRAASPNERGSGLEGISPASAASWNASRKVWARPLPGGHCMAFRMTKLLPPSGAAGSSVTAPPRRTIQRHVEEYAPFGSMPASRRVPGPVGRPSASVISSELSNEQESIAGGPGSRSAPLVEPTRRAPIAQNQAAVRRIMDSPSGDSDRRSPQAKTEHTGRAGSVSEAR
jgi:hypothetical protein